MKVMKEVGISANLLTILAMHKEDGLNRMELSRMSGFSFTQCAHVLSALQGKEFVRVDNESSPHGTPLYSIAHDPDTIQLIDLFNTFDDVFFNSACLFCKARCRQSNKARRCPFGMEVVAMERKLQKWMRGITIVDLVDMSVNETWISQKAAE